MAPKAVTASASLIFVGLKGRMARTMISEASCLVSLTIAASIGVWWTEESDIGAPLLHLMNPSSTILARRTFSSSVQHLTVGIILRSKYFLHMLQRASPELLFVPNSFFSRLIALLTVSKRSRRNGKTL